MTPREAFKFGFLQHCVQQGFSLPQIEKIAETLVSSREKQANGEGEQNLLSQVTGYLPSWGTLKDVGKLIGGAGVLGTAGLIAAPPILGSVGGYLTAKMTDIDQDTVDDVKRQELIDELDRQTMLLNQQRRLVEQKQNSLKGHRF